MTLNPQNPLAADLEEDWHQHLLESGNLINTRRGSHQWTGGNTWISQGYVAKILRVTCTCGAQHDSLIGIFHRETRCSETREQALNLRNTQFPGDHIHPIEITHAPALACVACLPSKGFKEI